jgi:peroxiredoxin
MLRRVLLLVAIPTVVWSCRPGQGPPIPTIGQPVPEVVLPDLNGQTVRLSDYRGEVVVLNFWATWCPPCVEEMPSLERLHKALGNKGLRVLAASVDDNLEDIERFRKQYQLTLPILHDEGGRVSHTFTTFKYPETYIVGRDGRLVAKIIGPRDWIAPIVIHDFVELLHAGDEGNGT